MTLTYLFHHPVVKGAISGAVGAAVADYAAFRTWKTWHDVSTYQWGIATWRWFQGAIVGAITAAGYGAMFGA